MAISFLRRNLDAGVWPQGTQLPALGNLALAAGVSRITMWKAVGRMKCEERLHTVHRGRITAGPTGVAGPSNPATSPWLRTAKALSDAVLDGAFLDSRGLPYVKELAARFRVSRATAARALHSLAESGLLIRQGRRYLPAHAATFGSRGPVVLICEGMADERVAVQDFRMHAFVTAFEQDCRSMGCRVLSRGFNPKDPGAVDVSVKSGLDLGTVAGYGVRLWWSDLPDEQRRRTDLLTLLARTGKPVAIFDESGAMELPDRITAFRNVAAFRVALSGAARTIARFLLEQGHRNLAYVSPHFGQPWAARRFAVLQDRIMDVPGAQIVPHTLDSIRDITDLYLDVCRYSPGSMAHLFRDRVSTEQLADLQRRRDAVEHQGLFGATGDPDMLLLRNLAHALENLGPRDGNPVVFNKILDETNWLAADVGHSALLDPLFERALTGPPVTAWIASDDVTAIAALRFLRRHNVAVPRTVSVSGFDNSPLSYQFGLTTYDFSLGTVARRMAAYIHAFPRRRAGTSQRTPTEVEGSIMVRTSVRNVSPAGTPGATTPSPS